ncbi:helix-turn-helix transcriptional regulator [Streptomyces sp. NPDC002055]|uniref:helix-turn-helix transcriptional regulator n=1 Tax=Streptomyces sp. NPDC002055 TaxID=3154534 RepID=UPI00332549B4
MTVHGSERRGLIVPVLLLLLAERPDHGYELLQRLRAFGWSDCDSAGVYRVLRGMEKDGMLASSWRASETGPARRRYEITPQGAMELALWFLRLGELHETLHVFLERYAQLPTAVPARGTGVPGTGRRATRS